MLAHSTAICIADGRTIGIEEVYTLSTEGKKINRPGVIEKIRKLGKDNQLICDCGCGGFLTLKAGEKMLRNQHFALKPGQRDIICRSTSETENTRLCKSILKCWLDNVLLLEANDIRYAVPYNELCTGDRRFELTFYIPTKSFGLIFSKTEFIDAEKLSFFSSKENLFFVAIAPLEDYSATEQYPEYNMRMQNAQGYCAFLEVSEEYSQCILYIIRYEKNHRQTWTALDVVKGPLSSFSISTVGELIYQGTSIKNMSEDKSSSFQKECEHLVAEAARKKKEKEEAEENLRKQKEQARLALEQERIKKEEERQKRQAEAAERLRIKEEQEALRFQQLIKEGERYLTDSPTKNALYAITKDASSIMGTFIIITRTNSRQQREILIRPKAVWYDNKEKNIVIVDICDKEYFIHLKHSNSEKYTPSPMPSGGYSTFPIYLHENSISDLISYFTSLYRFDGIDISPITKAESFGCQLFENSNGPMCFDYSKQICGKPNSSCGFRIPL